MTCGFYLGILLLRVLQALQVCSAWSQGDLSRVHGRFEGSSPQGDIRQAFVAKSSSPNYQGPYNKRPPYLASQVQSVKYYQDSLSNAKSYNTDTTSLRRGSSVSKHESFKQHNGVVRTLPSKQDSRRLSPYAKPDGHSSTRQQSGSWASAWNKKLLRRPVFDESALLASQKEKGFIPPKEHIQATSGLSRGSRVHANGGRRKTHASLLHKTSGLPMPWKFGFPQPQLVSLNAGVKLAPEQQSGRGQGLRYAPVIVHYIPQQFGGYPIKRLGEEKPVAQTTTPTTRPAARQSTLPQVRRYTFPPRQMQALKPRKPSVHKSSKWIRIQSKQLTGD